jgi:TPP-dependent pyruvate/acetoin dehydrogenase alpha subunit
MFAYYLPNVDTPSLSDERWAEMYKQLATIRESEAKARMI